MSLGKEWSPVVAVHYAKSCWHKAGIRADQTHLGSKESAAVLASSGRKARSLVRSGCPPAFRTCLEASVAQYLARRTATFRSLFQGWLYMGVYPWRLIWLTLKIRKKLQAGKQESRIALFQHPRIKDRLQREREQNTCFVELGSGVWGRREGWFIARCIWYCPVVLIWPRFVYLLTKWLSVYAEAVDCHRPATVVSVIENSFVSSLLTMYLNERSIVHENYMHGEYYSGNPIPGFSRFDRFYVYGSYWKAFFQSMRCSAEFVTEADPLHQRMFQMGLKRPPGRGSLLILHSCLFDEESPYFARLLHLIDDQAKNTPVMFKVHPGYPAEGISFYKRLKAASARSSELSLLPGDMSIEDAIYRSRIVVGYATAALMEAWIANRRTIYLRGSDELKVRYRGSKNVLFLDDCTIQELEVFLREEAESPEEESVQLMRVASVTG